MAVCGRCGQENTEAARFCLACGASLTGGELRQERKVVTVLFADLVGFTSRAEALDPEDVGAMLDAYHSRLKHELERHGGTVEKFIGDAVMALFGAPTAHEDDPERAVRAALEIRAAILELNEADPGRDLHVRVGITTGEALVTLDARPDAGQGMAAGDVVNTAARLQSEAPEDGILVDEPTRRAVEPAFDLQPRDPVVAKGKADPIPVWEVAAVRSSFGVDVLLDARTPLVGRGREREVLAQALARVRTELTPQLVTLIGVPGIGKSRLVWELFGIVDEDPDLITWRQGRCLPYGDGIAFWALGEMVKAQAGLLETDVADVATAKLEEAIAAAVPAEDREWVAEHLRPLVGLAGASGSSSADAFGAWRLFFESLAEQRPVVLVFEDLHWADDGLLDFVDYLVDWAGGVPLLVVCSARPELLERRPAWGGGKLNAITLALSPLGPEDSARLVATLLEQPAAAGRAPARVARAGRGQPAVRRAVRADARRPRPPRAQCAGLGARRGRGAAAAGDAAGDHRRPPRRVAGRPRSSCCRTPPSSARCSGSAPSDGERTERRELEVLLHALERKGFVRRERRSSVGDETEYVFGHALVRDVAYGQIPRIDRAREAPRGCRVDPAAVRRAKRGPGRARRVPLAAGARAHASRGCGPIPSSRRVRGRRWSWPGSGPIRLGAVDAAGELYARALSLAQTVDPDRPRLLLSYGRAASRAGVDADAELTEATERLLDAGEVEGAADALAARAWVAFNGGRAADARTALEQALELLAGRPASPHECVHQRRICDQPDARRPERGGDPLRHARARGRTGDRCRVALRRRADHDRLDPRHGGRSRGARADRGRARSRAGASITGRSSSAATRTSSRCSRSTPSSTARGRLPRKVAWSRPASVTPFTSAGSTSSSRGTRLLRGDWDESLQHLQAFLDGLGERDHYMEAPTHLLLGRIKGERGEYEEAVPESTLGLELARSARDHQVVLPSLVSHACVLVRAGRTADANLLVDEFIGLADWRNAALADAVLALDLLGRNGDAARIDGEVRDSPWGTAAEAFARGDYSTAADRYREAGDELHEAESRLRLAESRSGGDPETEARAAAAFFRRAAAKPRLAEAEALVRATAPRSA